GDAVLNPKGWPTQSLGEACLVRQYGTAEKANAEGRGLPVLRMNNLTNDGRLNLSDMKYVDLPAKEAAKLQLCPGDVLFNRTNSLELVGKTAVWRGTEYMTFAGYLVRLQLDPAVALPDYVVVALNMPSGKALLRSVAKPSINMANISASDLDRVKIAFPPVQMQAEFAEVVWKMDRLRAAHASAMREADTLFASLQERAFSGTLDEGPHA
ncbi:MAG: type I DNA specificity S subunit, partial [Myxococcota bacterium]